MESNYCITKGRIWRLYRNEDPVGPWLTKEEALEKLVEIEEANPSATRGKYGCIIKDNGTMIYYEIRDTEGKDINETKWKES